MVFEPVGERIYHKVCDALPLVSKTPNLPSFGASSPFHCYQVILLGDRGRCAWAGMRDTFHTAFDRSREIDTRHSRRRWVGQVNSLTATSSVQTLSYFVISYFHIFLLWFIDLRLGHSDIHIVISDTTSHWLACRPIRSQYAATSPPISSPLWLCPNSENNNGTVHSVPLPWAACTGRAVDETRTRDLPITTPTCCHKLLMLQRCHMCAHTQSLRTRIFAFPHFKKWLYFIRNDISIKPA